MKSKEEIEQLAEIRYPIKIGGSMWIPNTNDIKKSNKQEGYIKGYTQCQENIAKEIQSLIDFYKSDVAKLEDVFKDGCSIITLTEIGSLKTTIADLERILNKQD